MAVPARRDPRMRVPEYRDWAAARPDDERWELIDGVPVMMSPPKFRHQQIVANLLGRLGGLAEARGCWALPGLAILSESMDDFAPFPDMVVQCGKTAGDGYTGDPLLVAEVLSPSTLVLDRGRKTAFYHSVPSLSVLLLIYQDEARVEVWRREPEWTMRVAGLDGRIDLPEMGGDLAVAGIYDRLAF